jgi:hypothetical protein
MERPIRRAHRAPQQRGRTEPVPEPPFALHFDRGSLRLEAPASANVPADLRWDARVQAWRTEALRHHCLIDDARACGLVIRDEAARFFDCPPVAADLPRLRPDQEAAVAAWERAGGASW